MKKTKGLLLLLAIILIGATDTYSQVELYKTFNFTGEKITISSDWSASSNPLWNDAVRSIKVPQGWEITIYEHGPTMGKSLTLTSNWVADNFWQNKVSNIKVTAPGNDVIIYADCGYAGKNAKLGIGSWNINTLSATIGNDIMSSIKIPAGYKVTLYEHGNFQGRSIVFTGDVSCFVNKGWNDVVSSVKIEKKDGSGKQKN